MPLDNYLAPRDPILNRVRSEMMVNTIAADLRFRTVEPLVTALRDVEGRPAPAFFLRHVMQAIEIGNDCDLVKQIYEINVLVIEQRTIDTGGDAELRAGKLLFHAIHEVLHGFSPLANQYFIQPADGATRTQHAVGGTTNTPYVVMSQRIATAFDVDKEPLSF